MRLEWAFAAGLVLACVGCGDDGSGADAGGCATAGDCVLGERCVDGVCVATDAGTDAGGTDTGVDGGCSGDEIACGGNCCSSFERCFEGAECIQDLGTCTDNDDCASDSYCYTDGTCVPYGVPPGTTTDEECVQDIDIEAITPAVQCSWTDEELRGTPLVADFDFDDDPTTLRPSIVFSSVGSGGAGETLRIIDGETCELQHTIATNIQGASTVAIGDLDLDGRPEIVANANGVAQAWRYDVGAATWSSLWRAATCAGGARMEHSAAGPSGFSPSLHDLTDDGQPEVLIGGSIYDSDGCLLASVGNQEFDRAPVVADVDEDGEMEIVSSRGVFRYDAAAGAIVPESYFAGTTSGGSFVFAAVGDLGNYPLAAFGGEDRAEIVVVGDGNVRVETLEGTRLLTATLPSGRGGPPTIADFDGDGRAEFSAAAREEYVVFDLDCTAGGDASGCMGMSRTDGRLWARAVDEQSSGVTGSSVFDFDADGTAEVVYHDECFLRIFDGRTGDVLYSFPRYSLTWFEMPVIADVDGDFHTEIVVGAYDRWGGSCPGTDPYVPSVSFMPNRGVYVLRDERDRWAASRPIWNQHAYSITHVDDRGSIRRTSEVQVNWRTEGLNNFRQNSQGDLEALGIADLTASVRDVTPLECRDGEATVRARVCNRGRLPLGGGIEVALRIDAIDGAELCRTTIEAPIGVGECQEVACTAPAPDRTVDVYVIPDPEGRIDDCHPENGWGVLPNVSCLLL